ncbi:right-handed parallel beta-helix repeat-containing protein [Paenibacillus sp. N1-5-1-14]|uniref:right-handed parallel beta-helix repeat-containing protein n=1 Tax=Paenibacillus radicibacter TaxID=2972488 RepID=UPI002159163D|nr:right-handed parallel beta-helix repeat-containing protein [Paenibacillus radicibacter]MCR8641077.1 right-handed parallel beta-helix repeat-containing protein [Paenibacillus radicibacter]
MATVNVTAFGAVGNGIKDCSQAFQNAINSLMPAGGTVQIPTGVFILKNVVIKSNINLVGAGATTVLKLPTNGKVWDMVLITGGNVPAQNATISDMTIDGSADVIGLNDVQMHGIDVEGGTKNLTITRVYFQNTCGDGIRTSEDGSQQIVPQFINITNCTFQTTGRQDIAIVHAYDVLITNCVGTGTLDFEPELPLIKRVTASNCTFNELQSASKNDAELANIVVKDSTFQEGLLWQLRGMTVTNCNIRHMRVSTASDVLIQTSTFKMLELYPVNGTVCNAITITSNVIANVTTGTDNPIAGISGKTGAGLYMWNGTNCTITNNTIRGEVYSIFVSSGCNNSVISNNRLEYVKGSTAAQQALFAQNQSTQLGISGNNFVGWAKGILADGASHLVNCSIANNQFNLTTEQCIEIRSSTGTSITQNTFNANGAVYISGGTVTVTGNRFNNTTRYRVILEKCTATVGSNTASVFSSSLYKITQSQVTYI